MVENTNELFYTSDKAAELLGLSERVMIEKLRTGVIKGYKKYKWYILHSDLIKYIKSDKE